MNLSGCPSDSELKRPLGIGNEGYSAGLGIYNERAFFQIQFPYFKMKLSSYTYTCLINDLFEGTEMYGSKNGIEWILLEKHNSSGKGSTQKITRNHPETEGIQTAFSFFRVTNTGKRLANVDNKDMWLYGIELFGLVSFIGCHKATYPTIKIHHIPFLYITLIFS